MYRLLFRLHFDISQAAMFSCPRERFFFFFVGFFFVVILGRLLFCICKYFCNECIEILYCGDEAKIL